VSSFHLNLFVIFGSARDREFNGTLHQETVDIVRWLLKYSSRQNSIC